MSEKANYFKLGLFVISAFFIGVATLAVLGAKDFFKKEILVETCFDSSVQGLDVGSAVKYRGIQIGRVKTITLAELVYEAKTNYVLIIIALDPNMFDNRHGMNIKEVLKRAIKNGLVISLKIQGLTGVAYLETDYDPKAAEQSLDLTWEPKHPYIPSKPSTIQRLEHSISRIMENLEKLNIQGIASNIEKLFALLGDKIDHFNAQEISFQAESLLKEIRETNRKLDALLGSEKTQSLVAEASGTFKEAHLMFKDAREPLLDAVHEFKNAAQKTGSIADSLDNKLGSSLDDLSTALKQILAHLENASQRLDAAVWVNSQSLDDIMEDLKITSENLRRMSQDIRRYPSKLIFEKPPAAIGEAGN